MTLKIAHSGNPTCVLEFYEKLLIQVKSLETIGKLNTIKGHVRSTWIELSQIRSDLIRLDGE